MIHRLEIWLELTPIAGQMDVFADDCAAQQNGT
jgi:hypothetical protein